MRAEPFLPACTTACPHRQPLTPCTATSPSAASSSPMRNYGMPGCLWPTPSPRSGPSPAIVPGQSQGSTAGWPWRYPPVCATATSTHPRRQPQRRRAVTCTTVWPRAPSRRPPQPGMPHTSPVTKLARRKRDLPQRMRLPCISSLPMHP